MSIVFQKHYFKPKEKLTAQMLNELEDFVFELLLSKTYNLLPEAAELSDPVNSFAEESSLINLITLDNCVGMTFDGDNYICPIIKIDIDNTQAYMMGNIKAFLDSAPDEERAFFKELIGDKPLVVERDSAIPFFIVASAEGSQVYIIENGVISEQPFGTHTINPLFADLQARKMSALPDIRLVNNEIGLGDGDIFEVQGLTMQDFVEMNFYKDVLVKVKQYYCTMYYSDVVQGFSNGAYIATSIRTGDTFHFIPGELDPTGIPKTFIYRKV